MYSDKTTRSIIGKLQRKLKLILGLGKKISQEDSYVKAKFLDSEVYDKVPFMQHWGFKSVPPKDSDLLGICNGDRENLIIIGSKKKPSEPDLKEGEASIYADKSVHIKAQKLSIKCKDTNPFKEIVSAIEKINKDLNVLATELAPVTSKPPVLISNTKTETEKIKEACSVK